MAVWLRSTLDYAHPMTGTDTIPPASKAKKLELLAKSLTELQRTYLLLAFDMDQSLETAMKSFGFGAPPARVWRWLEYGPVGAKGVLWDGALRKALDRKNLVNSGTGAVWASLKNKGLIDTELRPTGFVNGHSKQPLLSLFVRMTTDGRKVSRVLRGEPMTKPKAEPKPLSLSALRLIEYGQRHPKEVFYWGAPWDETGFVPDYMVMLTISTSLIKRGYLAGEAPRQLRITAMGLTLDVTKEPNWVPLKKR